MNQKVERGRALRILLSEKVRMERARLQLSQEDLGHLAELSRVHIGAIERHEVSCTLDVLAKISHALGLAPHELLKPSVVRRKRNGRVVSAPSLRKTQMKEKPIDE